MIFWLGVALAGWADDLRPVATPWDAPDKWLAFAETQSPKPAPLACDVLIADHARLCFRVREGDHLRWVTEADMASWKTPLAGLRAQVTDAARTHVTPEILGIGGMSGSYLRWADLEGWAVAPLLHPSVVAKALGADARLAIPAGTVAVAWAAGSPDVDKALAVGVVELALEQPGEVTRTVFRWDGTTFVPFLEASPVIEPVEAPQAQP